MEGGGWLLLQQSRHFFGGLGSFFRSGWEVNGGNSFHFNGVSHGILGSGENRNERRHLMSVHDEHWVSVMWQLSPTLQLLRIAGVGFQLENRPQKIMDGSLKLCF